MALRSPITTCPYDNLFIYYCRGMLPSVHIDDRSGFLGLWQEDGDSFLFFDRPADETVIKLVKDSQKAQLIDRYDMSYRQWQGNPLAVIETDAFVIAPAWHKFRKHPSKPCLWLDPGVVFGNCQHPTTSDCLQAMQTAFERRPVRKAADLGTGTGILALAAVALGAERVLAVDLNGLATCTALRNARLNGMQDRILVVRGLADKFIDLPFDLVVSNIHYDVMCRLVAAESCRRPKQFVFSGLLRSQARSIEQQLGCKGIKIIARWQPDGVWHTFLAATG